MLNLSYTQTRITGLYLRSVIGVSHGSMIYENSTSARMGKNGLSSKMIVQKSLFLSVY